MRAVEEVVQRYHREQTDNVTQLREAVSELRAALHGEAARIIDTTIQSEIRHRHDLVFAADTEAARQSAELLRDVMSTCVRFDHPHATLRHALDLAPAGGMALEFGVFSGSTLRIIADARGGRDVYGFDSFDGLPEAWRTDFPAGAFRSDELPEVPGAELVVGWFDKSLPGFLALHQGPVDLLHVDCDLYSSARTVLDLAGPRLRADSIVVFDEYFNYPGWHHHEYRAWQEYTQRTGTEFSYESYTYNNEQVVVRVTKVREQAH
ncbi:class I SAM-dependent methyltransferase [Amycolatopsis sp. H20-H5]|nr:class I SAM-dependent methyltransferase [Amycolatopsis sp. H20-H5]